MYDKERLELIKSLKEKGIKNLAVLEAMFKVERHLFIPKALWTHAYKDIALPIGHEQTISQPYTVAFMTEALQINKDSKVLEIGTGSGYQATILHKMGARVYSIERNFDLYKNTQKLLESMKINVFTKQGDGTIGWNEYAPYDGIIVTAGAPAIPDSLKKQLAVGGRLVIPVGDKNTQKMIVVFRESIENYVLNEFPNFSFVPLIGREGWT